MPLTDRELTSCAITLAQMRVDIKQAIHDDLEQTGEQHHLALAGEVMDAGDLAVTERLAELDIAFLRHHVETLTQIEAAQRRLAEGTYGTCSECGDDIGPSRLAAAPTASRCLDCQMLEEQHSVST